MTNKSLLKEESINEVIDKYSAMDYKLVFINVNSKYDTEDIHQESCVFQKRRTQKSMADYLQFIFEFAFNSIFSITPK